MKKRKVVVSDHALVRWLERVHGIDMNFFRSMLAKEVETAVAMGATGLTLNGVQFVLDNGVLCTVRPKSRNRETMAG